MVFLRGTSYSLVQTLLLKHVSSSHNAQCHRQTDDQTDIMKPIAHLLKITAKTENGSSIREPTVTSLFEVRLHNGANFLSALVRIADFLELFNIEEEAPRTINVVGLEKFLEVDVMRLAVQHVLPHTAPTITNSIFQVSK